VRRGPQTSWEPSDWRCTSIGNVSATSSSGYGELLADDAVFRVAGVPAGMGGMVTGRQAIVDQLRQGAGAFEIKRMFGDDENVCLVGKVSA
jgi:ketosteroid isomerase-like protein